MNSIHIQYCPTQIGELILGAYENQLCLLDFKHRKGRLRIDNRLQKGLKATYTEQDDPVLTETKKQLNEYFSGQREAFTIPLLTVGTDFQKSVWRALINVPYRQTSTYLNIAQEIQNPKAVRAVANANGANAISIIIPCHRIIGTNGQLVGYAGSLPVKQRLLNIENSEQYPLPF
jgi:methylated-DNA-[protein]-cysteine S-methyltransferase